MERVERLVLEKNYQTALQELASQDQNLPAVVVERGKIFAAMGEYRKASVEFSKAAEVYRLLESNRLAEVKKADFENPEVVDVSPLPKSKYDWYQTPSHVFVSVTAKKVSIEELQVQLSSNEVRVRVQNKFELKLRPFAVIDPSGSSYTITEFKIELKLCKLVQGNWLQLEATQNVIPSGKNLPAPYASGKSVKDWSSLEKETDDFKDGDPLKNLLSKIYGDADEDTRRAMMKSYQTSGGTVLTTNWKDAAKTEYEKSIKPPKGQVYKTWEGEVIANDSDDEK